jgi:Fur family ferric uptake transcriptional regulator
MERSSRQRDAIRQALEQAGRPLLPTEILAAAQAEVPALGIATVYRNLKQLAEAGEVQTVELPGAAPRFEPGGHHHHHHFSCTGCQRVFDVHACPGDMHKLAPAGFTVERHELTLYGRCDDCSVASTARTASKVTTAGTASTVGTASVARTASRARAATPGTARTASAVGLAGARPAPRRR